MMFEDKILNRVFGLKKNETTEKMQAIIQRRVVWTVPDKYYGDDYIAKNEMILSIGKRSVSRLKRKWEDFGKLNLKGCD